MKIYANILFIFFLFAILENYSIKNFRRVLDFITFFILYLPFFGRIFNVW